MNLKLPGLGTLYVCEPFVSLRSEWCMGTRYRLHCTKLLILTIGNTWAWFLGLGRG